MGAAADLVQQRRQVLVDQRAAQDVQQGWLVRDDPDAGRAGRAGESERVVGQDRHLDRGRQTDREERLPGRPAHQHAVRAQQRHPPRGRVAQHGRQGEPERVGLPGQRGGGVGRGLPALRGRREKVVQADTGDQVARRNPSTRVDHGQPRRDAVNGRRVGPGRHLDQRLPDRSQRIGDRNQRSGGRDHVASPWSAIAHSRPVPGLIGIPYYGKPTLTTGTRLGPLLTRSIRHMSIHLSGTCLASPPR